MPKAGWVHNADVATQDEERIGKEIQRLVQERVRVLEQRQVTVRQAQAGWERVRSEISRDRRRPENDLGVDEISEAAERAKARLAVELAKSDARLAAADRGLTDVRAQLESLVRERVDASQATQRAVQDLLVPARIDPPVITEKEFLKAQNSVPAWVVGAIIVLGVAGVANAQQSEGLTWPVIVALGLALVSTAAGVTSTVHAIRRDRRIDKEAREIASGPTSGGAG